MSLPVHNMMSYARAQGLSWDDINKGLAAEQQAHLAAGGDFWEMTHKLGFGNPQILRDRLAAERLMDQVQVAGTPLDDYNSMTRAERKALMMGKRPGPRSAEDHAPAIGPEGPEPVEPDDDGWISSRGNR